MLLGDREVSHRSMAEVLKFIMNAKTLNVVFDSRDDSINEVVIPVSDLEDTQNLVQNIVNNSI